MMTFLWWFMLIVYAVCCLGLIVIVLLQKGKGTGFAGAFGVGPGSDTVFGPRMSKSLPVRLTYIMAGLFLSLALVMSIIAGSVGKGAAPGKVDAAGRSGSLLSALDEEPVDGVEEGSAPENVPGTQLDDAGESPSVGTPGEGPLSEDASVEDADVAVETTGSGEEAGAADSADTTAEDDAE
ncbi:MAG TPA: preprotein translocase subunit SecG [Candidatus Hydrogenedentes bacterium]|nr:preprotein translocase subunit SecG [Candidatus Hydrogenedentota bacterium]HIJ74159.1 preprotein translocase subunit SecG [Candidatus Hydrogenedentota bacterium]